MEKGDKVSTLTRMGVNVSSGTGLPWVVPDKRPLNDCCCCTQISRKLRNCTTTVTSIYKLCSTGTLPARSALWWCDKLNYYCFFFSVVCPMRQCCSVDDTSQEHTVVSLSPGWVDPDVDWLYISINVPHPAGTRPSTRSPPMTGWSEWHPMTRWWSCLGSMGTICPKNRGTYRAGIDLWIPVYSSNLFIIAPVLSLYLVYFSKLLKVGF